MVIVKEEEFREELANIQRKQVEQIERLINILEEVISEKEKPQAIVNYGEEHRQKILEEMEKNNRDEE